MFDEFSIIENLRKQKAGVSPNLLVGIGDDAAVVEKNDDTLLLYTCDSQVFGTHFVDSSPPEAVGSKAVRVTLSDIAAKGGTPQFLFTSIHLAGNLSEQYIASVFKAILKECKKYQIVLAGGNITKSKTFSIDMFLTGNVRKEHLVLRSGAKVNDKVLVTGTLGDAALGLYLLQHPRVVFKKRKEVIKKFLYPTPRLLIGQLLSRSGFVTSMIDISDGVSSDVLHIARESNVGVKLYEPSLPLSENLTTVCKKIHKNPYKFALNGGEDYEFCFTVSEQNVEKVKTLLLEKNVQVSVIGEILSKQKGRMLLTLKHTILPLIPMGWNHTSS